MNFLITTGSTLMPIDATRGLVSKPATKIGAQLVEMAYTRGHTITCVTSEAEAYSSLPKDTEKRFQLVPYSTFDDLATTLQSQVKTGAFDCIFHAAAVGDYLSAGMYAPEPGTSFNARTRQWDSRAAKGGMKDYKPGPADAPEGEVWLRLVKAPKLIDRYRSQWGYQGILVKFETMSGVNDAELLEAAEKSRLKSQADLMVVNTWEAANLWACLGPWDGNYERCPRREVPERLILNLEHIARRARGHAENLYRPGVTDHDTSS